MTHHRVDANVAETIVQPDRGAGFPLAELYTLKFSFSGITWAQ